ncbi:unnamed protein product [Hermetia illucens]|uniref:Uncharacterized protein n=1 Tax=Hermetia illucens TaxID=343691 RepID=A0A7R8YL27_HERIL|nr:unnamed protein product [Hermetia illucens]
MDLIEVLRNQIEQAWERQYEMEAMLSAIEHQYMNNVLPYVAQCPQKWLMAKELYDQACYVSDLMDINLEHIQQMEQRRMALMQAHNPPRYFEEDVGYWSDVEDLSSDDDMLLPDRANDSLGYQTASDHGINFEDFVFLD